MSVQDWGGFVLSVVAFGFAIEYLTGRSPAAWLKEQPMAKKKKAGITFVIRPTGGRS